MNEPIPTLSVPPDVSDALRRLGHEDLLNIRQLQGIRRLPDSPDKQIVLDHCTQPEFKTQLLNAVTATLPRDDEDVPSALRRRELRYAEDCPRCAKRLGQPSPLVFCGTDWHYGPKATARWVARGGHRFAQAATPWAVLVTLILTLVAVLYD